MFKNIWGWYPEDIWERSDSVEKFDVLIKKMSVMKQQGVLNRALKQISYKKSESYCS